MINWEAVYMINDALIHSISFNEAPVLYFVHKATTYTIY